MREEPPDELVDLLGRLRLANAAQVREAQGAAKRLAVGLPLFSSVWVDALAQAQRLSPFQAREINAGRGERLAVGPYVLLEPPRHLGYAVACRAKHVDSGNLVDLLIRQTATDEWASPQDKAQGEFNEPPASPSQDQPTDRLSNLIEKLAAVDHPGILPAEQADSAADRPWIAFGTLPTKTLADSLLQTGRLPWPAVAEIARQMTAALDALACRDRSARSETSPRGKPRLPIEFTHGDISASAIGIASGGIVQIARTGIRGIWRADERANAESLPPEAFDTLAPERIVSSGGPTTASDLYACGILWSHLLTGRCPLAGGDVRTKLRSVQAAKINEVQRLAPDTPAWLADAISQCTRRDPRSRPASFADLKTLVGASTPAGRKALAGYCGGLVLQRRTSSSSPGSVRRRRSLAPMAAVVGSVIAVMVACVAWPGHQTPGVTIGISPFAAPEPLQNAAGSTWPVRKLGSHTADVQAQESNRRSNRVDPAAFFTPTSDDARSSMLRPTSAHASSTRMETTDAPEPWILPSDKPLVCNGGSWSALEPGQTVRGRPGSRPLLLVPPGGMLVAAEDVRFENVDFAWLQPPDALASPERLALIELRAARATFQGCTFQAEPLAGLGIPVAIRWSGPGKTASATSGRLFLSECSFRGMSAGIEWPRATPAVLQINDSLSLGPGSFVNIPQLPRLDAPAAIALRHVTLRAATALLSLHADQSGDEAGPIQVKADECAFGPRQGGALLLVAGEADALKTARAIDWSGQGSLLIAGAAVAAHQKGDGLEPLAGAEVSIDGLVASRVEFAGSPLAGPAGSRLVRWQAPLESPDPPGIDAALPSWPTLRTPSTLRDPAK